MTRALPALGYQGHRLVLGILTGDDGTFTLLTNGGQHRTRQGVVGGEHARGSFGARVGGSQQGVHAGLGVLRIPTLGGGLGELGLTGPDELLFTYAQILDLGIGAFFEPQQCQVFLGSDAGFVPVDDSAAGFFVADEHVLSDGEFRDEGQLLVDDGDAGFFALPQVGKGNGFAVELDGALIGASGVHSGEDFHEGGFSGSVFPADGVDFLAVYHQVHIVEGDDAGKRLDNMVHPQQYGLVRSGCRWIPPKMHVVVALKKL